MRIGLATASSAISTLMLMLIFTICVNAYGHGGGLNRQGCHNVKRTGGYHCHRSSYSPPEPRQRKPVYTPAPSGKTPESTATTTHAIQGILRSPLKIQTAPKIKSISSKGMLANNSPAAVSEATSMSMIAEAQRYLVYFGYSIGAIDGVFGERTKAAVQAYQRTRSVSPSGVIEESLLDRMAREIDALSREKSDNKKQKKSHNTIERVQFYLTVLGLYAGPQDGIENIQLEHSVMRFQNSNKISVDGIISEKLLTSIKASL